MKKLKTVGTIVQYNTQINFNEKFEKIIIGIDPGLKNLGAGVLFINKKEIVHYEAFLFQIKQNRNIEEKLHFIFDQLLTIFEKHKPNLVIVEDAFVGVNRSSAIKLGLTRGAILTAIGKMQLNMKIISPKEMKMHIAGTGDADKEQIKKYLEKNLTNYIIDSLDISDAIALAMYGLDFFC